MSPTVKPEFDSQDPQGKRALTPACCPLTCMHGVAGVCCPLPCTPAKKYCHKK